MRLVTSCVPMCETHLKEEFLCANSWVAQQACGRWYNTSLVFGTSKDGVMFCCSVGAIMKAD